ncbi:hypothetical protein TrRE_jg7514 [Triparma retinervis]|uniref:Uncharacterized protein n=1 Tax=Triparma retinervis TaxID=2557542 RepID=A0A9W6ZBG1_9STRA|nr:hypothetical protein TrRE_jg7514 [Triparma retinervis]
MSDQAEHDLMRAIELSLAEANASRVNDPPVPPPIKRENISIDWDSMSPTDQLDLALAISYSESQIYPGGRKPPPQTSPKMPSSNISASSSPTSLKTPQRNPTSNPQEHTPPKPPATRRMKGIIVRSDPQSGTIYKGTMEDKKVMRDKMRKAGINYQNITTIDSTHRASAPGVTMKHDILNSLKSSVKGNDHVVFSYTGHGREGDGALALRRGQSLTAKEFFETWVETARKPDGSFKAKLTILNDSCFSGNWEEQARMFANMYPEMPIEVLTASDGYTTSNAYEDGSAATSYATGKDEQKYWSQDDNHKPQSVSNNMGEDEKLIGVKKRGQKDKEGKIVNIAEYMHKSIQADDEMRKDNLLEWARALKEEGWLEGPLESSTKDNLAKRINRAEKRRGGATDEDYALALQRGEENKARSYAALEGWETRRENEEFEKRSEAAKKGWETRRENEKREAEDAALARALAAEEGISIPQVLEAETVAKRSAAAKKGWETRRENEARGADQLLQDMVRSRRSEAAYKGWETRRASEAAAAAEKARRSSAASRGWETRRANEAAARLLRDTSCASPSPFAGLTSVSSSGSSSRGASQRGTRGTRTYVDNTSNRKLGRVGKKY